MWALLQPKNKQERLLLANTLGKHKVSKRCPTRIKFDLEKLKDPQVAESFQAMIGGRCAQLTLLVADDTWTH